MRTHARLIILAAGAIVTHATLNGCNSKPSTPPPTPLLNEIIVFDRTGKELGRVKNQDTLRAIWERMEAAKACDRNWHWDTADTVAKISLRLASGGERRFVLLQPDKLVEVGLEPDVACHSISIQELLDMLSKNGEVPHLTARRQVAITGATQPASSPAATTIR